MWLGGFAYMPKYFISRECFELFGALFVSCHMNAIYHIIRYPKPNPVEKVCFTLVILIETRNL